MYKIRQHIPNFVGGCEPHISEFKFRYNISEFSTLEELLNLEWINRYKERTKNFSGFVHDENYLMVIGDHGEYWWVVGYFERTNQPNYETFGLEKWDQGKYRVVDDEGDERVFPGSEVASSCGDQVILRDGRIMKRAGK